MDYAALFRDDRDAFVRELHHELGKPLRARDSDDVVRDDAVLAEMIRSANVPLKDLGVWWKPRQSNDLFAEEKDDLWRRLQACLPKCRKKDALTVFGALMGSVEDGSIKDQFEDSLRIAMRCPEWRVEAIKTCPYAFRMGMAPEKSATPPRERDMSDPWNPLETLAAAMSAEALGTPENLAATIEALKDAGVPHLCSMIFRNSLVHLACVLYGRHELEVFVKAFPECIDLPNRDGETPLHRVLSFAWEARTLERSQALIEAGADVKAKNSSRKTPLDVLLGNASSGTRDQVFQVAALLIDTKAYVESDIMVATQTCPVSSLSERVKQYFRAAQAKWACDQISSTDATATTMPRPL